MKFSDESIIDILGSHSIRIEKSPRYQGGVFDSADLLAKSYFGSDLFLMMLNFATRFGAIAKFGKDRLFFELSGSDFKKVGNSSKLLFGFICTGSSLTMEFVTRSTMANNSYKGNVIVHGGSDAYDQFISTCTGQQNVTLQCDKKWVSLKLNSDFQQCLDLQVAFFRAFNLPNEKLSLESIGNDFQSQIEQSSLDSRQARLRRIEVASIKPKKVVREIEVYVRNADVVAEALFRAKGRCEKCGEHAPFKRRKDSTPYLEVHHIIPLSIGGSDSLRNVESLCPNCHREKHFG